MDRFRLRSLEKVNIERLPIADVLIITILPLVMFLFFQRQIVAGLTSGAVKG